MNRILFCWICHLPLTLVLASAVGIAKDNLPAVSATRLTMISHRANAWAMFRDVALTPALLTTQESPRLCYNHLPEDGLIPFRCVRRVLDRP